MKTITILLTVLLTASTGSASIYRAIATKVIDGDTVTVTDGRQEQTIELANIDCPELDQPYGIEAAEFVRSKVLDKDISIKTLGKNAAREQLAEIIIPGGKNLNYLLVKEGLAWPAQNNKNQPIAKLANQAKKQKSGLWSQPSPTQPWRVAQPKKHAIAKYSNILASANDKQAEDATAGQATITSDTPKSSDYEIDASVRQRGDVVLISGRISGPECKSIRVEVFAVSNQGDRAHITDAVTIIKGSKSSLFEGEDTNYFYDKSRAKPQWEITSTYAFCN